MKKCFITLAGLACMLGTAHAQFWTTGFAEGGSGNDGGRGITTNAAGDRFVTGRFSSTASFGAGAPTHTLISSGSGDAFLVKYTGAGNTVAWTRKIGGAADESGYEVFTDPFNAVYVCGYYTGPITVTDGLTTIPLSATAGDREGFIAKYSTISGHLLWARRVASSTGQDVVINLTFDDINNRLIAVGRTTNNGTISGTHAVTAGTFVCSLDKDNGDCLWAYNFSSSTDNNRPIGLCFDSGTQSIFVGTSITAGTYSLTGSGGSIPITTTVNRAALYARYSPTGNLWWQWTSIESGTQDQTAEAQSIVSDGQGNVYISGYYMRHMIIKGFPDQLLSYSSTSQPNIFTFKIEPLSGMVVWSHKSGDSQENFGTNVSSAISPCGAIFVAFTAWSLGPISADGGNTTLTYTFPPGFFIVGLCVSEYSPDGDVSGINGVKSLSYTSLDICTHGDYAYLTADGISTTLSTNGGPVTITTAGSYDIVNLVMWGPNAVANAGADRLVCRNGAYLLGGTPNPGTSGNSYSWSPTTFLSCTTCAQPTLNVPSTGLGVSSITYTTTVTSACGITTDVVTVSPNWDCPRNRMANPDLSDSTGSFLFYPNPSNGQITVEGATEGQQIVVVSPDGRTVLEKPATGTTQVLDLSELAAGLYFIRITNNEGISVAEQKIILQ